MNISALFIECPPVRYGDVEFVQSAPRCLIQFFVNGLGSGNVEITNGDVSEVVL